WPPWSSVSASSAERSVNRKGGCPERRSGPISPPERRRTMAQAIAPIFVSHGAPDLLITRTSAHDFLRSYAADARRPEAILAVSAHFEAPGPAIVADPAPGMIYDFG